MSMRPHDFSIIPEDTAYVARAAFPQGNRYLTLRDELGVIYEDNLFAALFSTTCGRPAESPGCLALVTVLQFAENLSDRQAADAVRGRTDWKHLLALELADPGFDYTLLHEFRRRVLENGAPAIGRHAGAVSGSKVAQSTYQTAHRLDPRAGRGP
jgi:transposase